MKPETEFKIDDFLFEDPFTTTLSAGETVSEYEKLTAEDLYNSVLRVFKSLGDVYLQRLALSDPKTFVGLLQTILKTYDAQKLKNEKIEKDNFTISELEVELKSRGIPFPEDL